MSFDLDEIAGTLQSNLNSEEVSSPVFKTLWHEKWFQAVAKQNVSTATAFIQKISAEEKQISPDTLRLIEWFCSTTKANDVLPAIEVLLRITSAGSKKIFNTFKRLEWFQQLVKQDTKLAAQFIHNPAYFQVFVEIRNQPWFQSVTRKVERLVPSIISIQAEWNHLEGFKALQKLRCFREISTDFCCRAYNHLDIDKIVRAAEDPNYFIALQQLDQLGRGGNVPIWATFKMMDILLDPVGLQTFFSVAKIPSFQGLWIEDSSCAIRLMTTLSKPGFLKAFETITKEARFRQPKDFQELCEMLNLSNTLGIASINWSGEQPAFNLDNIPVTLRLRKYLDQYPDVLGLLSHYAFESIRYWSVRLNKLFPISLCTPWSAALKVQSLYYDAFHILIDKLITEGYQKETSPDVLKILTLSETLQGIFISCHSEQENLTTWKLNVIHAVQDYFKEAISANYPTNVEVGDNPRPRYLDPAIAEEIQKLEVACISPKAASSFLLENPKVCGVLERRQGFQKWIEVALAGPPGLQELHTLLHEVCHFLTAVAKRPHPDSTVLGFHLQNLARTARLPREAVDPLLEYANEVLARKIVLANPFFLKMLPDFFDTTPKETLEERLEQYPSANPFGYSILVRTARKLNESFGLTDEDFVRALLFWEGRRDLETKLDKKGLTLEQYAIKLAEQYTRQIKS